MALGEDRGREAAFSGGHSGPSTVKWNSEILGWEGGGRKKRNRREGIVLAMAWDLFIVLAVD